MENLNKILSDSSLKGMIWGLILIVFTVLIWVFEIPLFSITFGIISLVVNLGGEIIFLVYSEKKLRSSFDGRITFAQLFVYGFVFLLVAGLINLIFSHFLYHYIDPEYLSRQVDIAYDSMSEYIQDEDALEKAMKGIEEGAASMENTLSSFYKMWIGPVIISLITAIFIKKDINEIA